MNPTCATGDNHENYQWRIQDFPEEGAPTPQGAPTYEFVEFSQKLHEIERIWTPRGGAGPCAPLRSATDYSHVKLLINVKVNTDLRINHPETTRSTTAEDGGGKCRSIEEREPVFHRKLNRLLWYWYHSHVLRRAVKRNSQAVFDIVELEVKKMCG